MRKSIIIPCYNEKKTIIKLIEKVRHNTSEHDQIIIVDDFSNDGTTNILKELKANIPKLDIVFHKKNLGKGAAINSAKKICNGDIIIIQDADLEYDPCDFKRLVEPIQNNKSDVVYGSRVLNQNRYSNKNFTSKFRVFGNHILTIISNIINRQKLTDAHTCYKVFRKSVFDRMDLEEKDFAFCPEVTCKISKMGISIIEIPIKYYGRNYSDGKKIRFFDAFKAFKALIKYGL